MCRYAKSNGTARHHGLLNTLRKLLKKAIRMVVFEHQRKRPRPTAARQPQAQRRNSRHVVNRLVGALHRQRERIALLSSFHLEQSVDGRFREGTRGKSINRLGGKHHQFAFCQGFDGTVNHVARIVGIF